jgi:hypothetical protein
VAEDGLEDARVDGRADARLDGRVDARVEGDGVVVMMGVLLWSGQS